MIIAVSGKGGVGKTMMAALLVKHYADDKLDVLAVDADPDSNLPEALGISQVTTIGDIREEILKSRDRSPGKTLRDVVEYHILDAITETDRFDLIVMGRPEGSGCYCAVNHVLKEIIDVWSKNYDRVIIDAEAGLEHLSRRTTQDVDIMIVVTDTSQRSVTTAARIEELAKELDIKFKHVFAVINRANEKEAEEIKRQLAEKGLKVIGVVPEDALVREHDLKGKALTGLPENSAALKSTKLIKEKIEEVIKAPLAR